MEIAAMSSSRVRTIQTSTSSPGNTGNSPKRTGQSLARLQPRAVTNFPVARMSEETNHEDRLENSPDPGCGSWSWYLADGRSPRLGSCPRGLESTLRPLPSRRRSPAKERLDQVADCWFARTPARTDCPD